MNSGVAFPGMCIEPLLTKALRVHQLNTNDGQYYVVEYRNSKSHEFAFKFPKSQEIHIGTCEWCNSKNILKVTCKCKNVRYCNE